MKLLAFTAALLLAAVASHARPGETMMQWQKRFPESTQTNVDGLGVFMKLEGRKSGINIHALSQKNAVIYECYEGFFSNRDYDANPEREIAAILKSLSGGAEWKCEKPLDETYSRGRWTFGKWTADFERRPVKLHVFTADWVNCKLRNSGGPEWKHELPTDRAPKIEETKLGL